ncbi:MAG TPA: metalloregulator ArsR/SmtB family transcription factor [Acidimicrobiales bacterium]|nr:metalloregulator ArsR/SmtB family transcription factor [Acidimicrobiales bacterium]
MNVFEIAADPIRREIIEALAGADLSAGRLAQRFAVSGPAVSRHLRILREAGLVRVTRQSQRWVYSLEPEPLVSMERWARRNLDSWRSRLSALGAHLDRMEADESVRSEQGP